MTLSKHRPEWVSDHLLISFSAPLILCFNTCFCNEFVKYQTNLKELHFNNNNNNNNDNDNDNDNDNNNNNNNNNDNININNFFKFFC